MCLKLSYFKKYLASLCIPIIFYTQYLDRGVTGRSSQNSCYLRAYLSKCVESLTFESVFRKLLLLRYVFINLPCSYMLLNRQKKHRATYFCHYFDTFAKLNFIKKVYLENPEILECFDK